jgi:hypothetical protein
MIAIGHGIKNVDRRPSAGWSANHLGWRLLVENEMGARLGMKRFSLRISLIRLFFVSLCFFLISSAWAQEDASSQTQEEGFFTRGKKVLLLNVGAMAAIAAYGILKWDYGEETFNVADEGWFERESKYGGADKLGHFWSSYALSHFISWVYREWGYTDSEANFYGVLSNLGIQTFMEVADGFSSQGFSYEDLIMNIVGSGAAYIWGRYPNLARKIDLRMEYTPDFSTDDSSFSTNYENQKFLIALKADGFDAIKNPYLKYLEFHVGYYARGYDDYSRRGPDDRRRYVFVGLGFNVSRLLQIFVPTRVLDYIQIPYTSINWSFNLD